MTQAQRQIDPVSASPAELAPLYALADHLDATLAMGEDLQAEVLVVSLPATNDGHAVIVQRNGTISAFARKIRAFELGITSRLLQARHRATEVRDLDHRFAPILGLLVGGTAPLVDAAHADGGLGDISKTALVSGPDVLLFLISRSLVAPDVASLLVIENIKVGDDYLVAGVIHLGTLLDMVGQLLETLDLAFDLYAQPREADAVSASSTQVA